MAAPRMKPIDREALTRAIKMMRERGGADELMIKRMLADKERPWLETAEAAVYAMQVTSLCLKPWQPPPCWLGDDKPHDDFVGAGRIAAWTLRRRLIACGLSAFEPDPVTALAARSEPLRA